jgi:hypothetical protein
MKDFAGYTARLVKKAGKLFAERFSQDRVPLPVVFGRFRQVLENHNRAIEIITDMGEKLGGDYLFDIIYLRRLHRTSAEYQRVYRKLRAPHTGKVQRAEGNIRPDRPGDQPAPL